MKSYPKSILARISLIKFEIGDRVICLLSQRGIPQFFEVYTIKKIICDDDENQIDQLVLEEIDGCHPLSYFELIDDYLKQPHRWSADFKKPKQIRSITDNFQVSCEK